MKDLYDPEIIQKRYWKLINIPKNKLIEYKVNKSDIRIELKLNDNISLPGYGAGKIRFLGPINCVHYIANVK